MQTKRLASVLSVAVMLMAIIANTKKAADVMVNLGRPGTWQQSWDALLAAIALEAGFALFAFFLAHELRGDRNHLGLLIAGVVIMGSLSAVANIAYYTRYSPAAVLTWQWWQSVILGLSAPTVAIMTSVLAGVVESIRDLALQDEQQAEQSRMDHELSLAKERTAQARAEARQARAVAGKLPEPSGKTQVRSGNHRMTPATLLATHPDAAGWTGDQIAEIAGVSGRTGRNWKKRIRDMERMGTT